MEQLILHLLGDYVLQSGWMANNKTRSSWPALVHATVYALPFLLIASGPAWVVIWGTHFVIDRFRLARFVCYAKECLGPRGVVRPWSECSATGYHQDVPPWLAVWLMIAADNTLHLAINFCALRFLP